MKTIQPVTVWFNGEEQQATVLSAIASGDNLLDSASFSYQLLKQVEPNPMNAGLSGLVSGQLTMTGEAYQNWETNDYAYDWVAQQLNLTIIGPYVPPTTTTTTTTTEAPYTTTTTSSTTTGVPLSTTTTTTTEV
jgi:hypothetical protein